tara:strand:- start:852 stop:1397 length:546 start_codon:yes stop_codon:yes gene_type:complete
MFLLGVCGLVILLFRRVVATVTPAPASYALLSTTAVHDGQFHEIHSPADLPETVDFFMLSYRLGDKMYKLYRKSAIVPASIRRSIARPLSARVLNVISIDSLGNATSVADACDEFCGPAGNFHGNDVSLPELVRLTTGKDSEIVIVEKRDDMNQFTDVFRLSCWKSTFVVHTAITALEVLP